MWREGDEGEEGDAGRREGSCREGKGESESETEKGLAEPPRFDCVLQNDKVPKYCKINTSYPIPVASILGYSSSMKLWCTLNVQGGVG